MAETDNIEKKQKKSTIRKAAQKDESSITFYLHASLFLFFLTAYAFSLFLNKNKYPLILNNEILPEVLFAFFALLIFSFVSLFLLSFWRFLARVFIAAVAGGMVSYILGLLFPFNIGNYFAHYLSFLPKEGLLYIASNGNMIIAGAAGFVFFILLNIFKGGAMAFLTLPVLVALFMLLNSASKQTIPEKAVLLPPVEDEEKGKTENLIYLILADHAGYITTAESWPTHFYEQVSPTYIPSFYASNNFSFFPAAYLRYQNKYRNIGNVLNPSLTEINDSLFKRDDGIYYVSSDDIMTTLTRNDLFKAFKEKGYAINVYQSYPFNFCKGPERRDVSTCVTYPAPLGALYSTDLPTSSKLMLMAGHWLYSTPFGKQAADFVYKKLQPKMNVSGMPILGNPMSKSLPVGQSLVLSHLRHDVLKSKGKNVFFAHLNLPHHPYVYDQNCKLKIDPVSWRSYAPYTDKKEMHGELKRWEAYNQQMFCTYAQINYLIEDLKRAKLDDKTTIVIHGDKGADIRKEKKDENGMTRVDRTVNRFKNNMTTVFGIYTPKGKAQINPGPCDVATLVDRYVLQNNDAVCQPPDSGTLTREEMEKSMAWISAPMKAEWLKLTSYAPLYASWLEKGGQAFMALSDEQLKKRLETANSAKISFVAPPAFMEAPPKTETAVKEKTTTFVPVPEKQDIPEKTEVPENPKTADQPVPASEKDFSSELPANDDLLLFTFATDEKTASTGTEPKNENVKEKDKEKTPKKTTDNLGALPAPIVLPETGMKEADKWKSTEIKSNQTTTLELLPQSVTEADSLATLPEFSIDLPVMPEKLPDFPAMPATTEPPAPQAAPAAQVEVSPLPAVKQETTEIKAVKEAEEKIKAAEKAKAEAEAKEKARLKAEEEARIRAEAEAKARAEMEARLKAEEEARIKAEAEAKVLAEMEAKIKAAQEAREKAQKAEAAARAKVEEEARLKAQEEERLKAEEKEKEELRQKALPPPPNADELDIITEKRIEHVNEDGEVETYIYLERKPNPNRFKKKPAAPENNEAPAVEAQPAPAPENNEAPAVEAQPAPAPENNEAPAVEAQPAPAPENNAPAIEQQPAEQSAEPPASSNPPPPPAPSNGTERVLEE